MDERRSVEELEGAGDRHDPVDGARGRRLGSRRDRPPALPADESAEALTASEKLPRELRERGGLLRDGGENGGALVDQPIESSLDEIDQSGALCHTA
ncbi:hypothetical protein GCM10025866_32740 [Naasia aerilata]|uniref:Uncharacterized protein n=1 Tax=Naasia aerilata TaxID=1162966 RepID=A0ABN6XQU4_9MICO|nr:hypothetical protein GCM10025866_32740 [Naasia aerilata]